MRYRRGRCQPDQRARETAGGGGGIEVRDSTDLRIRYCTFAENRSSSGGAVLTDASSVDIQFSIFNKNRAKAAGRL